MYQILSNNEPLYVILKKNFLKNIFIIIQVIRNFRLVLLKKKYKLLKIIIF